MTQPVEVQLLERLQGQKKGTAFTPKDFLDLGSYESVKKALQRLANAGTIRRILRGVYDYPAHSAVRNGPASPDPDSVAHAIARAHGWTLLPAGETALNLLGLSAQVPSQWLYFSDGPSKQYAWEGGSITLKRRTNKERTRLSPQTALVVQGLKALGREHVDNRVLEKLQSRLSKGDWSKALEESRYATTWVHTYIKQLAG
jgi:hypothetical protein